MPAPMKQVSESASALRAASAAKVIEDLGLREAVGELERAPEPKLGGDVGEELVGRVDADRRQHRGTVGVGCGRVTAHPGEASERRGPNALLWAAGGRP